MFLVLNNLIFYVDAVMDTLGTCLKCRIAIPPDDAFCEDCGNVCLSCRTPIPPGDAYCDNCTCPQCQAVKPPDEPLCNHCQVMQDEEIADD